jgi:hypothetical protein
MTILNFRGVTDPTETFDLAKTVPSGLLTPRKLGRERESGP